MYHKRFMEELFKPQPLYSKKAMRTVFDRLAHASIMRLNAASMDKLYDLMTMAFKFQVSLSLRPKDIILTTLNHIDAIKSLLDGAPQVQQQVDHVYRLLIETFGSLSLGEFQLIRQTLLNFFQDMHIRVSIFLKDKVQSSNGRFVLPDSGTLPWKTESPGTIRLYDASGNVRNTSQFPANGNFVPALQEGSFDIKGSRVTKLGTNMYSVVRTVETISSGVQRRQANVVSDIVRISSGVQRRQANVGSDIVSISSGVQPRQANVVSDIVSISYGVQRRQANVVSDIVSISSGVQPRQANVVSDIVRISSGVQRRQASVESDIVSISSGEQRRQANVESDIVSISSGVQRRQANVVSDIVSISYGVQRRQANVVSDIVSISSGVQPRQANVVSDIVSISYGVQRRQANVVSDIVSISSGVQPRQANVVSDIESNTPDPLAKAQLDLLSTLIGGRKSASKQEIRLNLFNNDQEEDDAAEATMKPIEMAESKVVKIDASKKQRGAELNKIMGELNVQDSASHDDDLLDLMDSA
ncbi:protein OSCP1-like isoform X2 [Mizuhopecten yessoensis]|nr:protein OSCP1-like isoform X2 [Mizuhopecten yessoensis]